MELYLVRHGETEWNKERRLQGQADVALDDFGRQLAVETQEKRFRTYHLMYVLQTQLKRAKETAELILAGKDVPIIEDKRIIEMGFAEYEGKCCAEEGWDLPESFRAFFNDPVGFKTCTGRRRFSGSEKTYRRISGLADTCTGICV